MAMVWNYLYYKRRETQGRARIMTEDTTMPSDEEPRIKVTLDLKYETLLFFFESILPEVTEHTRASMAKVIANSFAKALHEAEVSARIDERKRIALDNYHGHTFSDSTNYKGKFDKFVEGNERRISTLTTEKEKR
jgi:hypothetical protein